MHNRASITPIRIATVDDLLKDNNLRRRVFRILRESNPGELKFGHSHSHEVDEHNEEIVHILENLGIVEAYWDKLKLQTHRTVGNRLIEIFYDDSKVMELFHRMDGINSTINLRTIELLSELLASITEANQWTKILQKCGVPDSFLIDEFYEKYDHRLIQDVLIYYASSPNGQDREVLKKIVASIFNPILYNGNSEKTLAEIRRFNDLLKYDGLEIVIDERSGVIVRDIAKIQTFGLPIFEQATGDILYDDKRLHIANPGDIQYVLCKLLFEAKIGDWITEQDIDDAYSPGPQKSFRYIKDAIYIINNKFKKSFNDKKLIQHLKSKVRIITENFI